MTEPTKMTSIRATEDVTASIIHVAKLFGATKGEGAVNKSGGIIAAVRFAEWIAEEPLGDELIRAFRISEMGL